VTVSVSLDELPATARTAWTRLRDELQAILADDLVAIWAYGSTIGADRPLRPADLDTHVLLRRRLDEETARRVEDARDAIEHAEGVEWDAWFILLDDARRADPPRHAYREGRRDTAWALHRAHWMAGSYVRVHGPEPAEIVPPPTWPELEVDLSRELEHIERHVAEGDTDPYEASYAILNGSRILRALQTRDVVTTKRSAGAWALEHLPARWHPAVIAAGRAYDDQATRKDAELLVTEMAPFVAMVGERLPAHAKPANGMPRWSGY
jgi:hypothetical protein